jgi:SAM-dependent methyltransferase
MRSFRTTSVPAGTFPEHHYESFPNMEARNGLQERIEVPLMLRALDVAKGGRVLEVGCGRGIALPVFAERLVPASLTGIDVDAELVRLARQRVAGRGIDATVVHGDVRDLPFEDGSFDLVVDFGTCYHVGGGLDGARRALREIARVLCAGGTFVHETPVAQHLAHPIRSFLHTLPWADAPWLARDRTAVLWSARRKLA